VTLLALKFDKLIEVKDLHSLNIKDILVALLELKFAKSIEVKDLHSLDI
jgi:hypothetical protein